MPLDGLRAWIGEVERKLGMRTRVFLVLATIAIGGAGAAVYLALDTRDDAVSESDVRALQEDLEARIGAGGTTGTADVAQLEAELNALEAEVEKLRGKGGTSKPGLGSDESGTGATGANGAGGASGAGGAATGEAEALPDALRKAQEKAE
jgi:hypothetical protein